MTTLPSSLLAWLLTYLIHSTALLGIAWLVTRRRRPPLEPAASDLLWKVALLAPLITGTIQSRLQLATPQAVRLPVAQGSLTSGGSPGPLNSGPATPVTEGTPETRGPGSENPTPSRAPSLPMVIVLLWAFIALASSLYYIARRLILVGRLADRRAVSDGPLVATLAELRQTTGFRRRVHLTMARTISSPVALGLSEICVPELALSELGMEQQRSMLAHELAHLARRDSLWLAGASLIERVFFFQPLNKLARKELETSAEYLSDEWAMRKTGSAVSLAKCLATVAEWIQASPLGVPVAGLAERRSLLVSRISRLLEGGLSQRPASRIGWAALATLGVVVTVAAAPRVSNVPPLRTAERGSGGEAAMRRGGTSGPESIDTTLDSPRVPPLRQERGSGGEDSKATRGSGNVVAQDTGVVVALIARLKDENAGVRRAAAGSLGRLGDPRAVMPLIAVLADSDAEVRSEAVDALSNFEDPRAINPIAALLKDPVTDVRHNALNALSHWDHGVPTAPVVALLDDP
ncbi:MAG TPA: HEAT repeat domain-containing protein, partial [Steroidobacteraceae bacterium]